MDSDRCDRCVSTLATAGTRRQRPCDCQRAPRRFSRRATLQAAAGMIASALVTAGFVQRPIAAQEATPAVTPQAQALADLTGVTPLPLTGERLATFEAYVAAKLAEIGRAGRGGRRRPGGEVAFLQGFGVRELGRPAPVTADTLLRIGSVTKSFSSLLAATLVDAGRLSWETPLVDLLPDFAVADPELTPRLTVADAFCACTGLPRRDWEFIFNGHAAHARAHRRRDGATAADRSLWREVPVQQPDGGGRRLRGGGGRRRLADRPRPCLCHRAAGAGPQPDRHGRTRRSPSPRRWRAATTRCRTARTSPARSTRCRCWRTTPGWSRPRRRGRSGRARGRWPATSRPS